MEFLQNSNVYATFYKEICMKINCTKKIHFRKYSEGNLYYSINYSKSF